MYPNKVRASIVRIEMRESCASKFSFVGVDVILEKKEASTMEISIMASSNTKTEYKSVCVRCERTSCVLNTYGRAIKIASEPIKSQFYALKLIAARNVRYTCMAGYISVVK